MTLRSGNMVRGRGDRTADEKREPSKGKAEREVGRPEETGETGPGPDEQLIGYRYGEPTTVGAEGESAGHPLKDAKWDPKKAESQIDRIRNAVLIKVEGGADFVDDDAVLIDEPGESPSWESQHADMSVPTAGDHPEGDNAPVEIK
jgi:hypothetical protein